MLKGLITAGIDIGSTSTQAVILQDNAIMGLSNMRAGVDRGENAQRALDSALIGTGVIQSDIKFIVGTGYGRYQIPFANRNITEITCHARGANYYFPNARTVLDMGGQDCKAIRCDQRGKVKAFVMNDKCAAGTGRAIEIIAKLLNIPIEDIGPLSLDIDREPPQLSSGCVVFAKSEALRLIRGGVSQNAVLAAYCTALAQRVISLIQRIGLLEEFTISGGIAKNGGVVKRIEDSLKVKAKICSEPQIVGALGAALIARDSLIRSN
jgi:bzd-type benzoyl-CoA reductase Q subunit